MEGILEGRKKVEKEGDRPEGRRGNAFLLTNERKETKEGSDEGNEGRIENI